MEPSRATVRLLGGCGVIILAASILACSNPLARFTKQYHCEVPGKPQPQTPYAYVERGMEHIRADQYDCALDACSEAIRLDSRLATGYACRGGVLSSQGEYLDALKDFDQALNLEPGNGDFYYSRAQVYERMGDVDNALKDLGQAVELIKSTLGRSFALALRAKIYRQQGRLDDSLQDYTEAIRLAPDFPYHRSNRGDVYVARGEIEKAIADYSSAISIDPQNADFRRDRAKAYRAAGQSTLAAADESVAGSLTSKQDSPAREPAAESSTQPTAAPISGGDLTNQATSLPKPPYPPIARATHPAGSVVVQVTVDETGKVVSAYAVSGHPLLQAAAVGAAKHARFSPRTLSGKPVKVTGTITYLFESPE